MTCRLWGLTGVLLGFAAGAVALLGRPWSPAVAVVLAGAAIAIAVPCRGDHRPPAVPFRRRRPDVTTDGAPPRPGRPGLAVLDRPVPLPPPVAPPAPAPPPPPTRLRQTAPPARGGAVMLEPNVGELGTAGRHTGGPSSLVSSTLREKVDERLVAGARRAID